MKSWQLIWLFSFLIILQAGWAVFRLNQLKQRKIEAIKIQEQRLKEQEEQVKEELKSVPEPEIEEKLVSGGRLWLEPRGGIFNEEFELEIWAESEQEISKVDLRIFYPSEMLEVIDEDWVVSKNGLVLWSSSDRPATAGRLKTIKFGVLRSGQAEIEFDFNKESLMDCNLLDINGKDILERVEGGEYTVNF